MKLIRNAHVYRICLPGADALEAHLGELNHRPILETEFANAGFVPVHDTDLVATFEGGLAFSVRYDEKLLPASVINAETKRRVADQERHTGVRMSKPERLAIKDLVIVDLLRVSHVRSKTIQCYYHPESRFLIVPVSSAKLAATITGLLVRAVGSAKTETINVSDVKGGLTTRLTSLLAQSGDEPFGEFELHPEVWLKGETGKVTYQIDDLGSGNQGLVEALGSGLKVEAVRLGFGPVSFKLTSDFQFRGVRFDEGEPTEFEHPVEHWEHEASVQVFAFVESVEALCRLFDYKPADETEPEAVPAE